jgi:endonuclease/exonuclease/phosphatase family metal-dependent hydrolase
MTYNIYYGGEDHTPVFGRNREWLGVIESRDPDVLLIEEANGWLPEEQNLVAACVESLNAASPEEPRYAGYVGQAPAFHVALLSRLPVLSFEWFRDVVVGADTVHIHHVFVHAALDLNGRTVHVIGAHFAPGTDRVQREKEARALLAILEGLPQGEPVWVGGDFNSYSPVDVAPGSGTEPDYAGGALPAETKGWEPAGYLLQRGFEDAYRTEHPSTPGYTQNTTDFLPNAMGPVQRVDFLMRSPTGSWQLDSAEVAADSLGHVASDHYAVFAVYSEVQMGVEGARPPARASTVRILPNPARGESRIEYMLTGEGPARVGVYTLSGRLVRTLAEGPRAPGSHALSWDGTDRSGRSLPAGIYLLRIDAGDESRTARIVRLGR